MQKRIRGWIEQDASFFVYLVDGAIRDNPEGLPPFSDVRPSVRKIANLLFPLRKQGCNIRKIVIAADSVFEKWRKTTGLNQLKADFSSTLEIRDKHNAQKPDSAVKRAIGTLLKQPLRPVTGLVGLGMTEVNEKLLKLQEAAKDFKKVIDRYLDSFYPDFPKAQNWFELLDEIGKFYLLERKTKVFKKFYKKGKEGKVSTIVQLTQSSPYMWGESVTTIVNELRRIGYNKGKEFETTGFILNAFYPDTYTDTDPALVRQMYNYYKKKKIITKI